MSTYDDEVRAAVRALDPQAVPLVGALVRHGHLPILDCMRGEVLCTLADLGDSDPIDGPSGPQMAIMVAVAHCEAVKRGTATQRANEGWPLLQAMGQMHAAGAALVFAMSVTSALRRLAGDTSAVTLQ